MPTWCFSRNKFFKFWYPCLLFPQECSEFWGVSKAKVYFKTDLHFTKYGWLFHCATLIRLQFITLQHFQEKCFNFSCNWQGRSSFNVLLILMIKLCVFESRCFFYIDLLGVPRGKISWCWTKNNNTNCVFLNWANKVEGVQ